MTRRLTGLKSKLRPTSVLAEIVWMFAATAALYVLLSPLAFATAQMHGLQAAGIAAAGCLLGGLSGTLITVLVRGLNPGYGMLLGMLPRMGLPLIFAVLVYRRAENLVDAGFLYYLPLFYLVTLAVETWAATARSNQSDATTGSS